MSEAAVGPASWRPADTFAARLILLRKHLRMSQSEAAALCGLDDGSWSNWENGSNPRNMGDIVRKIVLATGADRDWLVWGGELAPSTKWSGDSDVSAGQGQLYLLGQGRLSGIR